jgi:hypothetical protein
MVDRYELIEALKREIGCALFADKSYVDGIPVSWLKDIIELIEPRVISISDLFNYNNGLCFIEMRETKEIKVCIIRRFKGTGYTKIKSIGSEYNDFERVKQYNKTWRCWNIEPSYEKRMEVPWDE